MLFRKTKTSKSRLVSMSNSSRFLEKWFKEWPALEYPNIYHYFVKAPGVFTREFMKNRKSLEAHIQFAGHQHPSQLSSYRKVQRWTFKLHVIYSYKKNTFIKLAIFSHLRRGKISNVMFFFILQWFTLDSYQI